MKLIILFLNLLIALVARTSSANEELDEKAVTASARLNPYSIEPTQNVALEIELEIADGYSTYAEMYELNLKTPNSGFKLGKFYISPIKTFYDETSKKTREGVIGKAILKAPLEAPEVLTLDDEKLEFFLTYQACTKTYCLFPKTIEVAAYFKWQGSRSTPLARSNSFNVTNIFSTLKAFNISDLYKTQSSLIILITLFILGILTSFTPCVYPLIPITLAVLGKESHSRGKLQNFMAANIYVIGMSLTYATLGLIAAISGNLFGSYMNSPWVIGLVCLVFLSMSLSSFGLFEIQIPSRFQVALQTKSISKGYVKIFFTGLVAGLIAGPCVGPILVGVLTFISQTQNLWLGFWSLFAFALGMGQLLLVIGLSGGLLKVLPKSGAWMNGVKYFFGIILLGMFYYYLSMLIPKRFWEGALGIGLVTLGGFFHYSIFQREERSLSIIKAFSMATLLFGVFLIFWSVMDLYQNISKQVVTQEPLNQTKHLKNWIPYSDQAYTEALNRKKPIIIDFYADWCASCHELEQKTFANEKFVELTKDFTLLRFDATQDSPKLKELKGKYKIVGLPTIVFYDRSGKYRPEFDVNEFITVEEFESILRQLL